MKKILKLWTSIATLVAACAVYAVDSKPPARVMSLLEVETDDPSGYATWLADYNQIAKARLGIDGYLRVFQSTFDGLATGPGFASHRTPLPSPS